MANEVEKINWPQGEADVQNIAFAANPSVTIKNMFTILKFAILTGDSELDLVIDPQVRAGAFLLIKVPATANADDLALGDGLDAPAIVGVAGKTKSQLFVFDGALFVPAGAIVQID